METNSNEEIRYQEVVKRVKKLKGFYSHLAVYIVVNIMIIILNIQDLEPGESYFRKENFFTAFFWGLGLLAHALSTFVPTWFLGNNWEERKIKELIEKEKNEKWE
ncbi:2TM domain-containing protein [Flavobacterium sp.]|uniref:2TM domain-containing protein n=1 Tax=Flavobacterium sp. TaxID=239 RepID=UPI003751B72F